MRRPKTCLLNGLRQYQENRRGLRNRLEIGPAGLGQWPVETPAAAPCWVRAATFRAVLRLAASRRRARPVVMLVVMLKATTCPEPRTPSACG